jgi:hypothetical protein
MITKVSPATAFWLKDSLMEEMISLPSSVPTNSVFTNRGDTYFSIALALINTLVGTEIRFPFTSCIVTGCGVVFTTVTLFENVTKLKLLVVVVMAILHSPRMPIGQLIYFYFPVY